MTPPLTTSTGVIGHTGKEGVLAAAAVGTDLIKRRGGRDYTEYQKSSVT